MARREKKASQRPVADARNALNRSALGMTILQARSLAWHVVPLLVAIGAIYKWYDRYFAPFYERHPVISIAILGSFAVYVVGFGIGWHAWRRYRQAQRDALALTSSQETADTRYFRLDPYVTAKPAQFQREDDAHNLVLQWISETTRPILFLSGVSGSGKSSVLEAYVLPLLQADGWRIERIRSFSDPLPQLEAVEWTDRAAEHQTQACETSDVWPGQARFAPCTALVHG
jgi:hypothetical protein